jgi:chromosome segregation ATPase
MNPVEATAVLGVIATVVATVIVPYFLRKRQAKGEADATKVVSWQSITSVLQKERDDLRKELDGIEAEYRARFRALEEDYNHQLTAARSRIQQLEHEVTRLSARLYGLQNPGSNPQS